MKSIANDVWRILWGGSILAGGEIRPSKDTSIPLPSHCSENKGRKISKKPGAVQLQQTSFDEAFFLEDAMNNYSSKKS